MSNLTILNTSVRSLDNLYSLTDLHRLSGGEEKHRPSHFLRLDQTKDLISAIESENSNVQICTFKIIRGGQGGTYACEELALAYATWISPKFHLVVLRAFIAMHKGQAQPELPLIEAPKPDVVLTHKNATNIAKYLVRARAFAKEVETFHRKLHEELGIPRYVRNDLAAKGYDIAHEFNYWLDPFIEEVLPETTQIKRLPHTTF